jgi:hypothetical protein
LAPEKRELFSNTTFEMTRERGDSVAVGVDRELITAD